MRYIFPNLPRGTELKVYFSHGNYENGEIIIVGDLPVAYTKVLDTSSLDWFEGYRIYKAEARLPRFLGVFKRNWEEIYFNEVTSV